jgi:Ca2+/Na+ antiporter
LFPDIFVNMLTIPVASMITGMAKHFMFHILRISILRFLYFNFFSAYFCITFLSDGIATSVNKHILLLLLYYYYYKKLSSKGHNVSTKFVRHNHNVSYRQ